MSWSETMTSSTVSQNIFISRRPREANFADIFKIVATFIKTTFKDSKKVKRIRNYLLKCNLYLYLLIQRKLLIWWKNADVSRTEERCSVIHLVFGSFFWVRRICAKCHLCKICVADLRKEVFPIREQPRKCSS